jgi:hypothetical protein
MKLRDRLYCSAQPSCSCSGRFALAYGAFERSVLPVFARLLSNRAADRADGERRARRPLGADDGMLARTVSDIVATPICLHRDF